MPSFELAGQTVTFEQSGAGEPVLFVHGSFATSSAWRRIVAEMDGEQFRSIAIDPPQPGRSMAPATAANIRQWVDNLAFRPTLDAYRGVSVPVTLVVGEHAHPTSRLMSRRLAELMARSSIVEIEGAGHFVIHSHAAECAELVPCAGPPSSAVHGEHAP